MACHAALGVGRQDLPASVLLAEVEQDRAGLPDHEAAVVEHGDLVVRVERQELGLELRVVPDVDRHDLVGEAQLLQRDRDLAAIWVSSRCRAGSRAYFRSVIAAFEITIASRSFTFACSRILSPSFQYDVT